MSAASAEVPLDILQKLQGAAEQLGISLPGVARFAPTIDVTQDIRPLALEIGRVVSAHNIFMHAGSVVTVDEDTGDREAMSPKRFTSWVEEWCKFIAPNSRRVRNSIPIEDAVQVLASNIFQSCLRPLTTVHTMKLPVLREGGEIEFLEKGYDEKSGIFTVDLLPYEMDWELKTAVEFLNEHGKGYPLSWSDEVKEESRNLMENRSWSVQLAAMVGTYCRSMFGPGTTRPMIVYVANQPGTGKSTLVAMALNMVFGHSSTTKTPKDDDKMDSELETTARTLRPYLFFDDIGGGIFSNPLNRFITSQYHSGRVMGGNSEVFMAPAVTQVFATGNDIKLSKDLMRRCLAVELFLPGDAQARKFPKIISPQYLSRPEVRRNFLAAMCAFVRHYVAETKNMTEQERRLPHPLASFDEWTNIVGGIVTLAGYVDPTTPPELSAGGSEDEDEMRELLVKIASEATGDTEFDRKQLVEKARGFNLLESLVGSSGDKEIDSNTGKKLGRQLQKWRGREMLDVLGRKFRFGHQRQKRGAVYPLRFITAP